MHVYIYIYIFVYIHMRKYMLTKVFLYIYRHTNTRTFIPVYTSIYRYIHTHIHTRMHTNVSTPPVSTGRSHTALRPQAPRAKGNFITNERGDDAYVTAMIGVLRATSPLPAVFSARISKL